NLGNRDNKHGNLIQQFEQQGKKGLKKSASSGGGKDNKSGGTEGEEEEDFEETDEQRKKRLEEMSKSMKETGDAKVTANTFMSVLDSTELKKENNSYVSPTTDLPNIEMLKKNDKEFNFNKK
ncbi:TATA box-binding protein-associated factor, RNA polymerase III, subunit 2, partial [Reticulomyxa filosa]